MAKRNTPSLIDVAKEFGTEEQCIAYLEALRWPEGVRCLKCGGDKITAYATEESVRAKPYISKRTGQPKEHRIPPRRFYQCLNPECNHQFTIRTGTIFNDSHLPLSTWFMAVALVVNAKKGLSAKQLERDLHVSYPTAWYLYHRIREAMQTEGGLFDGVIEVDETFVGGRYDKRRKREPWEKQGVAGALRRATSRQCSQVKVQPIKTPSKTVLTGFVRDTVSPKATVFTDESAAYKSLKGEYCHDIVQHTALEYVRGDVHTNGIESFWSLFKRGVIGNYHQVSIKHLVRYLNEFQFRFNNREAEDLFLLVLWNLVIRQALTRAALIGREKISEEPF